MNITTRPDFGDTANYVAHVAEALAAGEPWAVWPPETKTELAAVVESFPEHRHRWLPSARDLAQIDLPAHLGRDVLPFDEEWQERFLTTLQGDAEFRAAVVALLAGDTDGRAAA